MEGANEDEPVLVTKRNKQKGKFHMDPMTRTSWPHKEYSVFVEEDISLLGTLIGMLETTSRGFETQTFGVG